MDSTIDTELKKNGITVVCPINQQYVNQIAYYVATTLVTKFPTLRLRYQTILSSISNLKMFIADMPNSTSGACYFYKNSTIYFKKGLRLDKIKKLAIHECIHYFQEVKDKNGQPKRMGLCSYYKNKAYGNALNEASVQLMSAYATNEKSDNVTYYGISFRSDSPSYYPILCNLIKQIGYLTGFPLLFESTFYSNDAFFDKFKSEFGKNNAFKIQSNCEKILSTENKIATLTYKIQSEDLEYHKFKRCSDEVKKGKDNIKKLFFDTQNLIIKSFFDKKISQISNQNEIEQYRKYLYSYSHLIGTSEDYSFFNQYYIDKMAEIDEKRESLKNNTSLIVNKKTKLALMLEAIKKIFSNQRDAQTENSNNY